MSDLPPGFELEPQQPQLPPGFEFEQPPSVWSDIANTIPAGLARGAAAAAGLPGFARDLVNKGADYIMPLPPEAKAQMASNWMLPNAPQIQNKIEGVTGPLYQPQTTPGKYFNSVAEMAPGMVFAPGSMLSRTAATVGAGIGSEAAGQATEGSAFEPYARVGGAILGGGLPNMVGRAVTPLPVSVARQQALDTLANEGITSLTAGQKTGNVPLRYAESIFGDAPFSGGKAQAIQDQGLQQFTKAATSRAGINGLATPDTLYANSNPVTGGRLGNVYDTLSARNDLKFDPQFAQDLNRAVQDYLPGIPSQQNQTINRYYSDIMNHAAAGPTMPGTVYQDLRSRLGRQAFGTSDTDYRSALKDMQSALDNAMGRSISPADKQAWQQANQQYAAQKVLEKAAGAAGTSAAEGYVTPQQLRTAIASGQNRGAYARGQGQFADLARAGNIVMSPLPNSGTAQRWMELGGGAFGLEHALSNGFSPEALAVATGAVAGPGMAGRVLLSKPVQKYLSNQLLGQPSASLAKNAQWSGLVDALMQASRPQIANQSQ